MLLSKTDFQIGRRCIKRLWHEKHGKWHADLSANGEKNAFEGNRFNDAVREYYPKGIMVGWGQGSIEKAVAKTEILLKADSIVLFEAFFMFGDLLCLADVIVKENGNLTLIEAKSSNNPKITQKDEFEHIYDSAFQTYVMTHCGYKPEQVLLLHANGECIWPNKESLFRFVDVTEEVLVKLDEVKLLSNQFSKELKQTSCSKNPVGRFCKKPVDKACPHLTSCWNQPTEKTIYDLPRMTGKKLAALESENVHLIEDIPVDTDLSDAQRNIVNLVQRRTELVDKVRVKSLLGKLEYPLHFFDFETYNPAVPNWEYSSPWQQIPFQYSLHILHEDGNLEHFEYLHIKTCDPRPELIATMKSHFLERGSLVVYYAPFEISRIKEMAKDFPQHADFLLPLCSRVWDELEVFKHCFDDHRLALSKSIKVVLPTYVPELSYNALNIQKGDQAQLEWQKMINLTGESDKQKLAKDLKEYCKLDTKAMVALYHFLEKLVRS